MRFFIVDCFAEEKYEGNKLLVILADRPMCDREQQAIAREINFSETAFVLGGRRPNGGYDVRIWTPHREVPFAGHPTLGTAHVIRKVLENDQSDLVTLNLAVGQIPVRAHGDSLFMTQNQPEFGPTVGPKMIADVFGLSPADMCTDFPIQWVSTGLEAVLIPLASREALARATWNRDKFVAYTRELPACYCNHLFFVDDGTGRLSARCLMEDFVEDPATGSANGDLAAYLLRYRWFGSDDISYTVVQGEDMGRRSILRVRASVRDASDADSDSGEMSSATYHIEVGGKAQIVAEGDWR